MDQSGDEGTRSRLRLAAEQLYEDTRLRDALDDEQAARLLSWGTREIERAIREAGARSKEEAEAQVEERMVGVREVLARINRLVERYAQWSKEQRREEISALIEWLCRVRPERLTTGDVLRLEALPENLDAQAPQRVFSALFAALSGEEEE
ncbi:MAG: hypothetical protein RRC07_10915 [Anaerolineae bacterium]|nr:hypothetical protein [Anaerolineae bacterium]